MAVDNPQLGRLCDESADHLGASRGVVADHLAVDEPAVGYRRHVDQRLVDEARGAGRGAREGPSAVREDDAGKRPAP